MCARLFTKGAAEVLLEQCSTYVSEDSSVRYITDEEKQQILQSLSQDGKRCMPMPINLDSP
jgi:magnesium-transporting ATPase (P-type)